MSKITPDGFSTTSETSLTIGGSEPRGIALDAAGNVYMPNFLSNNLTKITPDGTVTILTEIPSNQQAKPVGIAIDKAGNIYTANISVGQSVNGDGPFVCGEVCDTPRPGGITKTVDSSIVTYPATGDTSPIRITGLTPRVPGGFGTEYLISLIAVSDAGESGMSNRVLVTPTAPIAPDAPTIDSIRPGAGQLTVAFTPGYDNGSPITSYTASCLRVVGSGRIRINVVGSTSPIAVTSMYNGDTYECFVTATNIFGTGPASATSKPFVVGTVTISEPGAPQITNIEPGDAQASISVSVADDGWSPITGYNAYCFGDRLLFGASPTSPIAVSGLTNGVSYTCSVTATNDVGESPASATSDPFVVGAPDTVAPPPPPSGTPPPSTETPPSSATPVPTSPLWLLGIMAGLLSLVGFRKLRKS
jgi:titin